ncbi:hypothetical protein Tco_0282959 [Tanacetum coccineum]
MLQRCKDANLFLNWEKCHFMVKEGILLGHKVFGAGLEVDKAKIDVISKLPPPTNVKGIRNFLGHAGTENVVADHLSRIEYDETSDDNDVDDNFPSGTLMEITTKDIPWFADFANYLSTMVGDLVDKGVGSIVTSSPSSGIISKHCLSSSDSLSSSNFCLLELSCSSSSHALFKLISCAISASAFLELSSTSSVL